MRSKLIQSVGRISKGAIGWILFTSGLYRLFWRQRGVIVVFHRINDSLPHDPITSSSKDFERFVQFFARFFRVVSVGGMLTQLEEGGDLSRLLAVTFDDGYQKNASVAAPILEKHGMRGCFFLPTDYIGSDFIPWWDSEQNIKTEWMDWDQVRALHAAGHEIGSHTMTHVNLGVVPPDEARQEILGGRARLERELNAPADLFAYPYGGKRHMSTANLAVIRTLGLRCNLSAYGGYVRKGDDPFTLKRVNISGWFISPWQFGYELLTGRLDA